MSSVAILVPVLRRPQRVQPLLDSLLTSVEHEPHQVDVVFVCSPGDVRQIRTVLAEEDLEPLMASWQPGRADYARKINLAAAQSDAEWLFHAADDLRFHTGWLAAALAVHERTGALVIGTNDLGNATVIAGHHATHSLVHRSYLPHAVVDAPGHLLSESYDHNCVDVELVETAIANRVWAFAKDSLVEHEHWLWRKAPRDATYRKAMREHRQDRRLLEQRRRLWQHAKVA